MLVRRLMVDLEGNREKTKYVITSKGFWRWCVTLITTKILDDGQSPEA
jgi:hypothetical protein